MYIKKGDKTLWRQMMRKGNPTPPHIVLREEVFAIGPRHGKRFCTPNSPFADRKGKACGLLSRAVGKKQTTALRSNPREGSPALSREKVREKKAEKNLLQPRQNESKVVLPKSSSQRKEKK